MLIPEATGLQIKSLVLDLGYVPSNCLSDTSLTPPKTMQVITIVLSCPTKYNDENELLKTLFTGHEEIKYLLSFFHIGRPSKW